MKSGYRPIESEELYNNSSNNDIPPMYQLIFQAHTSHVVVRYGKDNSDGEKSHIFVRVRIFV
jgi:hypothetical protein